MGNLPFQNNSLGISPETLNQFWEQFQFSGNPNGAVLGTVASDVSVTYQLTSAQLLALQTTAVQLVAPPVTTGLGNLVPTNGYLFSPTFMVAEFVKKTTAYTIGNADNAFQLEYTGKSTSLLSMTVTGLVDQAANTYAYASSVVAGGKISLANSANLGLEVKLVGTTPALTLGDGTVYLNVLYNVFCML